MTQGLGTARMNDLRNRVAEKRALAESVEPYSGDDMEFEPLDAETLERVNEAARKAK